ATDTILRQEQAGFKRGKSCIDHIFTLRQILEQSTEWNSTIYIAFIDFEKAFDSLHRESLWRILRHYGIPQKMVNVIKILYTDVQCQVACNIHMSDSFSVKSGLEDLDYADDIGLLSNRHKDMQEKMDKPTRTAPQIGLKLNTAKTKLMRINNKTDNPITINNINNSEALEDVQDFAYLGSKITTDGDSAKDATARIRKIWKSKQLRLETKLRLYNSNVLSVLLYGSECWKLTAKLAHNLETFQNKCLRKILGVFWPNTITNEELHRKTDATALATQIKKRRWRWLGHVCRMSPGALPKTALRWTADGKGRRGRPKETWRRTVVKEMKECG
ncbi:hypothetical protein LSAT2_031965, partial [Lamellibrachia satsuma]